jgi:hypothetical protein
LLQFILSSGISHRGALHALGISRGIKRDHGTLQRLGIHGDDPRDWGRLRKRLGRTAVTAPQQTHHYPQSYPQSHHYQRSLSVFTTRTKSPD